MDFGARHIDNKYVLRIFRLLEKWNMFGVVRYGDQSAFNPRKMPSKGASFISYLAISTVGNTAEWAWLETISNLKVFMIIVKYKYGY